MEKISALIYDIEILRAIPSRGEPLIEGVEYCGGWGDHKGMGIACIGAYDYTEDRYRVFTQGNLEAFVELVAQRDLLVGFNSIQFDNAVMRAHEVGPGFTPKRDYDIMGELLKASGQRAGLDACCSVNFGTKKSGDGAMAPVDWQRGHHGKVIDYCLNDVKLTRQLFELALQGARVIHPKGGTYNLKHPFN